MTRRPAFARPYSVGITMSVGAAGELGLYENGLRQNVIFLHQLFSAAPNCRRVHLCNHGDGDFMAWPEGLGMNQVPVVRTRDVAADLDVLIVLGASVDPETLRALRERGVTIISYKGGNGAVISIEAMIARPPRSDAERYFDADCYDAIWMTPQHIATYAGWCRTLYRVPVQEVPQIWAPTFIANRAASLTGQFGYQPGRSKWRLGVMEPNITVMKTSHMPMLVCEAAWRRRPAMFDAIYVSNSFGRREQPHFKSFANALGAVKAGIMTFEPRFVSADFLANHCDAVVVHQWENGLNYTYYEVLYGGYPLVHNSPFLAEYGYFYPEFDPAEGAAALLRAFDSHDADIAGYKRRTGDLLDRLSPVNEANIWLHEGLIFEALDRSRSNRVDEQRVLLATQA